MLKSSVVFEHKQETMKFYIDSAELGDYFFKCYCKKSVWVIFPISRCHFHLILSHEIFQLNFLYDLLSAIPNYKEASRIHTFQFVQLLKPSWGIQGGQKIWTFTSHSMIYQSKSKLMKCLMFTSFLEYIKFEMMKCFTETWVRFSAKLVGPFSTSLYSNPSPWHARLNSN